MNSRKKHKLKAKRTPWAQTRYAPRKYVWERRKGVEYVAYQEEFSRINRGNFRRFLENFDFEKFREESESHQARVSAFIDQKLQSETKWRACNTLKEGAAIIEIRGTQTGRYRK